MKQTNACAGYFSQWKLFIVINWAGNLNTYPLIQSPIQKAINGGLKTKIRNKINLEMK